MLAVRRSAQEDLPAVIKIVRGLLDYFTDDVADKVDKDAPNNDGWQPGNPSAMYVAALRPTR